MFDPIKYFILTSIHQNPTRPAVGMVRCHPLSDQIHNHGYQSLNDVVHEMQVVVNGCGWHGVSLGIANQHVHNKINHLENILANILNSTLRRMIAL